jgi:23S rRNA-/tRNA-specific pseudouridylate synthase
MAKTKEIQSVMNKMFMDRQVHKKYLAIVRGYTSGNLSNRLSYHVRERQASGSHNDIYYFTDYRDTGVIRQIFHFPIFIGRGQFH